jgi:hypothetical protein
MKEELKSGIVEFDLLVEQFENGEISFVELTSALWNKGYKEGKKQAYSQTLVSGSVCYCGKPSVEECEPCCSLACALKPKMYR